ncbi:MAG: hypothetical protein U0414_01780 [Polyangiaceae bacterium]
MTRALRSLGAGILAAVLAVTTVASAKDAKKPVLVDRIVVRWSTTDRGVTNKPQIIFARELAFEARLEAMAGGEPPDAAVTERYLRAALNRHISESLLSLLPVDPEPTVDEIAKRADAASSVLEARVGGMDKIAKALELEGLSVDELAAIHRRSARASFYLDRMIAPQIEPTRQELVDLQASGTTPYTKEPFDKVEEKLRRWLLAQRLNDTLDSFFQKSRSKIVVTWAEPQKGSEP